MNIKLVNSKVNTVLRSITNISLPIKIEEIAESRGLTVVGHDFGEDVSGVLSVQNGIGTIGYNRNDPKVRRRFTIAHELGHYELHRDKADLFVDKEFIYRSANSGDTPIKKEMEQEANFFASAILMPSSLLREEIESLDLDLFNEAVIKDLAKKFEVSSTAMSIRISNLGLM
jgi:Zn-dependent peptidase ImmA (M78 family)